MVEGSEKIIEGLFEDFYRAIRRGPNGDAFKTEDQRSFLRTVFLGGAFQTMVTIEDYLKTHSNEEKQVFMAGIAKECEAFSEHIAKRMARRN